MSYLLIVESDPQFVATKDLTLYTQKNGELVEVFIEKDSPVGLLRTKEGAIHLGKTCDVLEFSNKTVINDLLESCQPANFELIRDNDGNSVISSVLFEGKVLVEDKILRIDITESVSNTLKVQKIR